ARSASTPSSDNSRYPVHGLCFRDRDQRRTSLDVRNRPYRRTIAPPHAPSPCGHAWGRAHSHAGAGRWIVPAVGGGYCLVATWRWRDEFRDAGGDRGRGDSRSAVDATGELAPAGAAG